MLVISFWSWQPQRTNWSSPHSRLWNICFLLRLRRPQRRSNSDTKKLVTVITHIRLTLEITGTEGCYSAAGSLHSPPCSSTTAIPKPAGSCTKGSSSSPKGVRHSLLAAAWRVSSTFTSRVLLLAGESRKQHCFLLFCWTKWTFQNKDFRDSFKRAFFFLIQIQYYMQIW